MVTHSFIVVNTLITPAILGIDYFASLPINIVFPPIADSTVIDPCLKSVLEVERAAWTKCCAVVSISNTIEDQIEDYAIPVFSEAPAMELSECKMGNLQAVVHEFQQLFKTTLGKTDASYHYIPTTSTPVRVPPRCIPIHYRDKVLKQLHRAGDY